MHPVTYKDWLLEERSALCTRCNQPHLTNNLRLTSGSYVCPLCRDLACKEWVDSGEVAAVSNTMSTKPVSHYEDTLSLQFTTRFGGTDKAAEMCLDMAHTCDHLYHDLLDATRRLSREAAKFADDLVETGNAFDPPMSVMTDLIQLRAAYKAKTEDLQTLISTLYGKDFRRAWCLELEKTFVKR